MENKKIIIHCIGDSHANFFSGQEKIQPLWPEKSNDIIPFLKSYRLGAVLAYNLCKLGTKMKGREKLFSILKQLPKNSTIMLCFGEIDCRAHLLKQAKNQNREINGVVKECVERYFSVIMEVKKLCYNILIWNATPSAPPWAADNPEYPTYGSCLERNKTTKLFNSYLKDYLKSENIPLISILDKLIDKKGMTKSKYLIDEVHLSQEVMLFAVEKINKALDLNLKAPKFKKVFTDSILKIIKHKIITTKRMLKKLINKLKINKRAASPFLNIGFHGDRYLCAFALRCISKAEQFIETGSNVGSTLVYVLNNFPDLAAYSCEPDKKSYESIIPKISKFKKAKIYNQLSPDFLYHIAKNDKNILNRDTVFWLDAHDFGYKWPLKKEIAFITNNFKKGYIFIDDFKIPGQKQFYYSHYDNQVCSYDHIKNSINPNLKFNLYYPNYTEKTSKHHPLTGWGLIEFGHDQELKIPEELNNKIIKA